MTLLIVPFEGPFRACRNHIETSDPSVVHFQRAVTLLQYRNHVEVFDPSIAPSQRVIDYVVTISTFGAIRMYSMSTPTMSF